MLWLTYGSAYSSVALLSRYQLVLPSCFVLYPTESGLPLADVAWTQPLSKDSVAKAAVRCCLEGAENLERGGKGKDSGDALVLKVQDMAELVSSQT